MIVDTEKTNCSNCIYLKPFKPSKEVLEHLKNPGPLYACNGVDGFGIVGEKFYCTNHTKKKK
jgi:hypothetical protein